MTIEGPFELSTRIDLNGAADGNDFAVDRANGGGLVSIASHGLIVHVRQFVVTVNNVPAGLFPDTDQLSGATIRISNPLPGDVLGVLTAGTNIHATYSDGVLKLVGFASDDDYQRVLRTARYNSTSSRAVGDTVEITFEIPGAFPAKSIVTTVEPGTASVTARQIFYNYSGYDGDDPAANAADDAAIATDKQVLSFDQTATVVNYTNYSRGLNGLMIDIAGPHGTITAEDFIFQVGNNNLPDTWQQPPEPTSVITRAGAGVNGSDRVELIWADGAIANQWLEVVVAANRNTGLTKPNTFYVGNATGEAGNSAVDARVTAADVLGVVSRLLRGPSTAGIADASDFNRDGRITAADALAAINRAVAPASDQLKLINVASIPAAQINQTISALTILRWPATMLPLQWATAVPLTTTAMISSSIASDVPALSPQAVAAAFAAPSASGSALTRPAEVPASENNALDPFELFNAHYSAR
jgi:hypothetical protein